MAESTDKINLSNPTEVARETLRRLAMRRIAPTPDNYLTLYEEIVGKPTTTNKPNTPSAETALTGLVMDLNLQYPELADPLGTLEESIRKSDWTLTRKQLGQIARQLKKLTEGTENSRPQSEDVTLLRDLLAKTLEYGVVSQLSHDMQLGDKARALATAFQEANSAAKMRAAATSLKSLWVAIEMQATDAHDQQDTLKRILLLLVENIGELLDDDTWLRGQLNMVQDVLAGPLKTRALQEAEARLKEVIFKQSMVKHGLREATTTLKNTMKTFVSRMSEAVTANDEYQDKITAHVEQISNTEDVLELNKILENLLEETRLAQANNRRAHDQLVHERDMAIQAENRIKDLETELAQMSALVREDPLTHSLNRRGLDDEFARESSRADRYKHPFCVALIDIDNFKALNDTRGHLTGDEALIHLVKIAKEELRLTDHIARLGGEEFLIILPNTPVDGAVKIVTRLQRSLTKKYFLDNNEKVLITFSAGVALRAEGEAQEAVIARADAAMYQAKQTGKNRVCTAMDVPGSAAG